MRTWTYSRFLYCARDAEAANVAATMGKWRDGSERITQMGTSWHRSIHWKTSVVIALCALPLVSTSARAQSETDLAIRRQLIDDAGRAAQNNQHDRALDLAQRAGQIRMTPSLRSFIAGRLLALSRFVEASTAAEQCLADLRRDATVPDRERLYEMCTTISTQASARVGRISIEGLDATTRGLTVTVNGTLLNTAFLGVPVMANPGTAVVEVSAPGFETVRRSIEIQAQQTTHTSITLAPSAGNTTPRENNGNPNVATGPTDARTSTNVGAASNPNVLPTPQPPAQPSRVAPIMVMSVGGAGVVTAIGLFAAQSILFRGCTQEPNEILCNDEASRANGETAVALNRAAIGTTIAGGAILAGGVVWYLLSGPRTESASRSTTRGTQIHIAPIFAEQRGIAVGGRF